MKDINIQEVKNIAFVVAKKFLEYGEPIPQFNTRFPYSLESCLASPFQKFDKKYLYSGLIGKASILFYLMIKNHPFQNGNKRIAVTTLLTFLYKNNKWIKVDPMVFYNFAVWVAQSPAEVKDDVVRGIERFIKKYIVSLK